MRDWYVVECCNECNAAINRVGMPCPESRPGCAVFHYRKVCPNCGDIEPSATHTERRKYGIEFK